MLYRKLCEIYEKLEKTSKRLEKTFLLSELLKKTPRDELKNVVYLARGKIFPDWSESEIGMSSQLVIKCIEKSTGISEEEIVREWRKIGDLGNVAELFIKKKKQHTLFSSKLTVKKVIENLQKVSSLEGKGTVARKISLVSELLTSSLPLEARYIIRTILGELRIGVASGVLRDAIVWAFGKVKFKYDREKNEIFIENRETYNKIVDKVQSAYDVSTDFGIVVENIAEGKNLEKIAIVPGRPIKVMLALKTKSIKDAFESLGKPCAFDYKYDGFRLMIHKTKEGKIKLFTRRLDDVTKQFPEVVEYVKKQVSGKNFILDSEAVGFDPKSFHYRPFQEISQRIKRKYDIQELRRKLPVEVNVFDIIYYNNKSLIREPFKKRRKIIEKIIKPVKRKLVVAKQIITDDEKKASAFYKKALSEGLEGLMPKNLEAPYKPGSRVGYMLKLKPELRDFDLVITGAEWGTGKRKGWLSSFILSCRDEKGNLLEIGKVGTGVKEKSTEGLSFMELTKELRPLIIEEKGREVKVKPKIVVAVTYQEIQKSPTYSSGFALRFPRITRLRPDKSVSDITSISEIKIEYEGQRKKKI